MVLSMRADNQELPAGCILLSPWLDLGRDRRAIPDLVHRDVLLSPDWLSACARAYAWPAPPGPIPRSRHCAPPTAGCRRC